MTMHIWLVIFFSLPSTVTKVGFESPTYTINEGSTTSVCLTLDRKLEKPISLNYTLEAVMTFGNKRVHFMTTLLTLCVFLDNNEVVQSEIVEIGENAGPGSPFEERRFCFEISLEEDDLKESREAFSLSLQSDDECVMLGRDTAIITAQPNGGKN